MANYFSDKQTCACVVCVCVFFFFLVVVFWFSFWVVFPYFRLLPKERKGLKSNEKLMQESGPTWKGTNLKVRGGHMPAHHA